MRRIRRFPSRLIPTCRKETLERRKSAEKVKHAQEEPIPTGEFVYRLDTPYPELVDVIPNKNDVKQLKMLLSGTRGELTGITTYLYQHYILQDEYRAVADALEQIAITEMTHYELLSEAVVAFGGDPNLTDGQGNVWTGRNVNTTKDIRRILEDNIRAEENAIDSYTKASRETNNQSLADLYLRIIEDEKLHIIIFERLLNTLN